MSNIAGSQGVIKIGATAIAEIKNWSVEETDETLDTTSLGKTARSRIPMNIKSWSGSLDGFYDPTDTDGQSLLVAGAEVQLDFYYQGETTGLEYLSGNAIITTVNPSASFDGMTEVSFSFEGNGALNRLTAV